MRSAVCAAVFAALLSAAGGRRLAATPSPESSEAACACTTNGFSGTTQTGQVGCFFDSHGEPLCYVASPGNCTSVTLLDSDSFANAKLRECPEEMIPIMNEVDIFTTATGRQDETSASPQYSPQLSEEVELVRSLTPESERQIQDSPSPGPSPAPRTLPSFVVDDPYPSPSSSPSSPSPSPYQSPSPSPYPSPSPSPSSVGVILADNAAHAGNASYVGYPVELSSTGSAQLVEAIEQSLAADEAFVVYAPRGFVDLYLNPALQQVGRNLGASLGLSVSTSSNSPFGYETVVAKPFYALGGAGR